MYVYATRKRTFNKIETPSFLLYIILRKQIIHKRMFYFTNKEDEHASKFKRKKFHHIKRFHAK